MTNFYIEKGPNWLEWYPIDHTPLQICAVPRAERMSLNHYAGANWQDYGFARGRVEPEEGTTRYPMVYPSQEELNEADAQLELYGNTYNYIKLAATFRTEFNMTHSAGEYALRVEVLVENPKYVPEGDPNYNPEEPEFNTLELELGFPQFSGAPYQFNVDTPQVAYYEVPVGTIRALSRISLYQNGEFLTDVITDYTTDGQELIETKIEVKDKNNIFCDNIEIRFCDKINLTDTLYYCWIETPRGDKVYSASAETPVGKDSVSLIAHLQYGYEDLVAEGTCEIHWFRQDFSVTAEWAAQNSGEGAMLSNWPDSHNKIWTDYTGPGWIPMEYLIADGRDYYNVDYDTLTVRREAVPWKWRYKVVVIYNDNVIATAEQDITRFDSPYDLTIEQISSKDNKQTMLRIDDLLHSVHQINPETAVYDENNNLLDGEPYWEWFGTWYIMLQDGSYTRVSDAFHHGPFDITRYAMNEVATFLVMCYDPYMVDPGHTGVATIQAQEVGNLTFTIMSSNDASVMAEWIGKDSFNYDAQGSAYPWIGEQEWTLTPKLTWAAGFAADYLLEILAPDGTVLGSREHHSQGSELGEGYTIEESMMTDMWVDLDNVIHFRVREKYEEKRLEKNTFTLRIKTLKKEIYTLTKTVSFIKDGDQGTQGSDWIAPVWPCNYKEIIKDQYDENQIIAPFMERIRLVNPLVLIPAGNGGWMQDERYRVFLRPFVQKNGTPIEQLDPSLGYYYKVWYDLRFANNWQNESGKSGENIIRDNIKYASHLRMYHTDGTIYQWQDQGTMYELGGKAAGETNAVDEPNEDARKKADGFQGFGLFPSKSMAYAGGESGYPATDPPENYGAIEIKFIHQNNLDFKNTHYNFYVRAQIDIYSGAYDENINAINPYTNKGKKVASIHSWYPIDVFFNADKVDFDPAKFYCNWPTHVVYNSTGYDPNVNNFELKCYYSDTAYQVENDPSNVRIDAENLTPTLQYIQWEDGGERIGETEVDKIRRFQKYRPLEHIDWQHGLCGSMRTIGQNSPFGNGYYVRCQMFSLNKYGNVDANAWDGQSIDINDERGTIFAPTVGAGYKDPFTNTFTGIIMGIDTSQTKEQWGNSFNFDDDDIDANPYMVGLYGYQEGSASFGIMENGTAFFGRADRGGRIIIDGYNATIYGGANGVFKSPEIGDAMWNAMRLNFVDLTHRVAEIDKEATDIEKNAVATDDIRQGFGNHWYGEDIYGGTDNYMPKWYAHVWQHAYVRKGSVLPYYLEDLEYTDLPQYQGPDWIDSQRDYCYRVNYYDQQQEWVEDQYTNPEVTTQRSLFGPSRASTTPAIEIGQHVPGLMPGVIDWVTDEAAGTYGFEDVLRQTFIPGDRNFMVTYDGTLWAMNGVFMGNVIGSNIVGGRIQGAEIGIGTADGDYANYDYLEITEKCNWQLLQAPVQEWASDIYDEEEDWKAPTAFYVNSQGEVWAKSLRIYGGLINIGSFHILGDEWGDDEAGHLVQFGESDFVGPTHFYGNIAIGPDLRGSAGRPYYGSNNGNLFQTAGYVGLGVGLPDGEVDQTHAYTTLNEMGKLEGPATYKGYQTGAGTTGIGQNNTLQQIAFFGLDTLQDSKFPVEGRRTGAKVRGHFWPLTFYYTDTNEKTVGQDGPTVAGYVTTMDIFKSKGLSYSVGSGPNITPETNYFRIGPWGSEGMVHWFRKSWQNEDQLEAPEPENKGEWLGWLGLQSRAGYGNGDTGLTTQASVGISTWYTTPIIFNSDGESAWNTRGHFHFFANGHGGNVNEKMKTWSVDALDRKGAAYGVAFNLGSNIGDHPALGADGAGNIISGKTGRGYIGFSIQGTDNSIADFPWVNPSIANYAGSNSVTGFYLDPYGKSSSSPDSIGAGIWTTEGNLHFARINGQHGQPGSTELWLSDTSLRGVAKDAISFALNYQAHQIWNDGCKGFAVDAQNTMLYHDKSVLISGTANKANSLHFYPNKVGFEGIYAIPENQFNIFARFG